jgi:hypothetical protein
MTYIKNEIIDCKRLSLEIEGEFTEHIQTEGFKKYHFLENPTI